MIFAEFGTGQVFWSMLWFFLFFIWIWMLIVIFGDIFRSPDLSGWGKALWTIFVIVLPYLGVFVYLIARGKKMQQHTIEAAQAQDAAMRQYVHEVASSSGGGSADEIARLAALRDQGVLSEPSSSRPRRKRCPDRGVDACAPERLTPATCHLSRRACCPGSASSIPTKCGVACATRWPSSKMQEFAPSWPC